MHGNEQRPRPPTPHAPPLPSPRSPRHTHPSPTFTLAAWLRLTSFLRRAVWRCAIADFDPLLLPKQSPDVLSTRSPRPSPRIRRPAYRADRCIRLSAAAARV